MVLQTFELPEYTAQPFFPQNDVQDWMRHHCACTSARLRYADLTSFADALDQSMTDPEALDMDDWGWAVTRLGLYPTCTCPELDGHRYELAATCPLSVFEHATREARFTMIPRETILAAWAADLATLRAHPQGELRLVQEVVVIAKVEVDVRTWNGRDENEEVSPWEVTDMSHAVLSAVRLVLRAKGASNLRIAVARPQAAPR